MSDFFDSPEPEEQEERPGRLERRKGRRRALVIAVAVTLVITLSALGGVVVALKVLPSRGSHERAAGTTASTAVGARHASANQTDTAGSKEESSTPAVRQLLNLLVIGAHESNGHKVAKGLLFAKIDLTNGTIQAVNIPERTYIEVPSLGLDQVGKSYSMGLDVTKKTVEGIFHVPADAHIIMPYEDFEVLASDGRFQTAFDRATESSLTAFERGAYSAAVSRIDPAKATIVLLPVKYMSLNSEPFYEPNNEEISSLVASVWGIKIEIKTQPVRVIVLNGSGQPGAGKVVSDKLAPNGFVIVDTKNASSFNYKKTQIVAYKQESMDKAKVVQQLLGVGNVVYHPVAQDVAEIAVIVGQDLKVTN